MPEPSDFNKKVIEEFRANGGIVGGYFTGATLLLLTTTGAKSGRSLTTPLMYQSGDGRLYVFASKAGAPTNPGWYYNLIAHPRVTIEVGNERYEADATVVTGPERDRIYQLQAERAPAFAEYQAKTSRVIPVVALTRAN